MNIAEIFQVVNDFLPKDVTAKAVSIYPLPYSGFYEVYVECDGGKRYRALASKECTISEFVLMEIPGGNNGVK